MENNKGRGRVAVVGCGPCGMAILAAFAQAEKDGVKIPEIDCFEKQSQISGLWNYTWRTGLDEHGEYIHNSMYRYLWSNGPKECLEMANYTFDEHFKKPIPSFPPRVVLRDYLMGRANKYNIERFVQLNTVVRSVEEKGDKFLVTTENLLTKKYDYGTYDHVAVATGHFSVPHVPTYPGLDAFTGRVMHAHDFRAAEEFANKTVLLIGSSFSAEDIGLQCYKYGAKKVVISHRTNPMSFKWPDSITEVPQIVKVEGDVCHFTDESKYSFDVIMFCTGYQHHFPFLLDSLELRATNLLYPNHLYKGVVSQKNERLLYLGMQNQYYTFTMFDVQAWYARDCILGKIKVPPVENRDKDVNHWYTRGQALKDPVEGIDFQRDYVKDLLAASDYPENDVDGMALHFQRWEKDKKGNILTYRDQPFQSVLTGTMSPVHHTAWVEAMDDSLEEFMNTGK